MSKVLVTGGAGFVGSFIVDLLISEGFEVTVYDNLNLQVHPTGNLPDYYNHKAKFVKGDILDYDSLKVEVLKADYIIHNAAAVGVGQSMYQVKHYIDTNVSGIGNLFDILINNENHVKKIVFPGSMTSYGEGTYSCFNCGVVRPSMRSFEQMQKGDFELYCPKCGKKTNPVPTPETAELRPTSVYGKSKMDQEEYGLMLGKIYGIPVTVLRGFNIYGPRQALTNPYTGVTAIFMAKLKEGKAPVIYEDGKQTRDFIYVEDAARLFFEVLKNPNTDYQSFNMGSGTPINVVEVARTIARCLNVNIEPIVTHEARKSDLRYSSADISKITLLTKWRPLISFEEGIKKLVEWGKDANSSDDFDKVTRELKEKKLI